MIGVRNLRGDAGIYKAPVEITGEARSKLILQGQSHDMSVSATGTVFDEGNLADGASVVATVQVMGGKKIPGVIRQGRFLWYVRDSNLSSSLPADAAVIKMLKDAMQTRR